MRPVTPPRLNAEIGKTTTGLVVTMGQWLYDFLRAVVLTDPNPDPVALTVGASPYTYTNSTPYASTVIVNGGTVSSVQFGRNGVFYTQSGAVQLSPGDSVRVTYTVAPTMTVIPR